MGKHGIYGAYTGASYLYELYTYLRKKPPPPRTEVEKFETEIWVVVD